MNPSNSEVFEDKWVFLSVFGPREQWHILVGAIHRQLAGLREGGLALARELVFFSLHRGPAIRLALYFHRVTEQDCRMIEQAIREVLPHQPPTDPKAEPPAGSFFMDFPGGAIEYNLFNERYILPGELGQAQDLVSGILCTFFEDHPVDDQGIAKLLCCLQQAIPDKDTLLHLIRLHLIKIPSFLTTK